MYGRKYGAVKNKLAQLWCKLKILSRTLPTKATNVTDH